MSSSSVESVRPIQCCTPQAGAALAAGCTVVIKPAEDTPLSAEALVALGDDIGIPEGVLNLVTCSRTTVDEVGTALVTHPLTRKVGLCRAWDCSTSQFWLGVWVGQKLTPQLSSGVIHRVDGSGKAPPATRVQLTETHIDGTWRKRPVYCL